MVDQVGAGVIKPPAILKGDNYRTWAMKLKASLKVMSAWGMVEGTEVAPPPNFNARPVECRCYGMASGKSGLGYKVGQSCGSPNGVGIRRGGVRPPVGRR